MNAEQRIANSRTRLVLSHPWFAGLILRLEPEQLSADEMVCVCGTPSCATDGSRMIYCSEFVDAITNDELDGLIAHEALHPGFLHHLRRGDREPKRWNVAADHAINLILSDDGFKLPRGGCCDPQYSGMAAEDIYELLPDNQDMPGSGLVIDGDNRSGAQELKQLMVQALHAALRAGRLTDHAERIIGELTQETISWQEILAQFFVRVIGRDDYSWKRFSRRGIANDMCMPSMSSDVCPPVVICIDSSGSISSDDLNKAVTEIRNCIDQVRPLSVVVIIADCEIQQIYQLEQNDPFLCPSLRGGGGTDFRPAIKKASELDPCTIIYITDLYGEFGGDPGIPTIWITQNKNGEVPFGEKILLTL